MPRPHPAQKSQPLHPSGKLPPSQLTIDRRKQPACVSKVTSCSTLSSVAVARSSDAGSDSRSMTYRGRRNVTATPSPRMRPFSCHHSSASCGNPKCATTVTSRWLSPCPKQLVQMSFFSVGGSR